MHDEFCIISFILAGWFSYWLLFITKVNIVFRKGCILLEKEILITLLDFTGKFVFWEIHLSEFKIRETRFVCYFRCTRVAMGKYIGWHPYNYKLCCIQLPCYFARFGMWNTSCCTAWNVGSGFRFVISWVYLSWFDFLKIGWTSNWVYTKYFFS